MIRKQRLALGAAAAVGVLVLAFAVLGAFGAFAPAHGAVVVTSSNSSTTSNNSTGSNSTGNNTMPHGHCGNMTGSPPPPPQFAGPPYGPPPPGSPPPGRPAPGSTGNATAP